MTQSTGNRSEYVIEWQHTFGYPKLFMFDARILGFFVLAILWFSKYTIALAVLASIVVFIAEIKNNMSLSAFFKATVRNFYDSVIAPISVGKTAHGSGWRPNTPSNKIARMRDKDFFE